MRNVLILAIEFAPYNTPGAFRTIYFTKYLVEFGYRPIVLTVKPPEGNKEFEKRYDENLLHLLSEKTVVHQLQLEDYSYSSQKIVGALQMFLKTEDRYAKFWKKSVEKFLPEAIKKYSPELLYTTCPFNSLANFSVNVSKQYKLPLVLDMRDNWSQWVISPYATYYHYWSARKRERRAFLNASRVVTVTQELKNIFLSVNSSIMEDKITVIPNGYDFDVDFNKSLEFKGGSEVEEKIIISYVGSYYYDPKMHTDMFTPWYKKRYHKVLQYSPVKENWLYRSPYFFFLALKFLFELSPELKNRIEFHQIGKCPSWLEQMVAEFNLTDNFVNVGFIPKSELQAKLQSSDFFLGTAVKVEEGLDYAIASKTFDYLSVYKPILSFTVAGAQSSFTEDSNCGLVFNPDELEENARKLEEIFKQGISLRLNKSYLEKFHRKNTAKMLSGVFDEIIESSKAPLSKKHIGA